MTGSSWNKKGTELNHPKQKNTTSSLNTQISNIVKREKVDKINEQTINEVTKTVVGSDLHHCYENRTNPLITNDSSSN